MVGRPASVSLPRRTARPLRLLMLSPSRQRLVRAMQRIWYGRIMYLTVRGGEPVFSPMPIVRKDKKYGGPENAAPPETVGSDFILKPKVVQLFAELDRVGDGVILNLEIKGGLPFTTTVDAAELL